MHDVAIMFVDEDTPRARLALLLEHFSELSDDREPGRIMYPLEEVLLLVTCATIASCDDFDDIVAWGEHHLDFLRRFAEFHFGVPCERWLRSLVNRIDPVLFGHCFDGWIAALWPDRHDLIAIDGKTARRTHDRRKGLKALHTLSAYASNARLTLAQLSVPEKTNEITAIPDLLDQLAEAKQLEGALVTIDAMGCQVGIADKIVAHKADYLFTLKGNQPTLEGDVERYFGDAPADELVTKTTVEKGHGRIETRRLSVSRESAAHLNWPGVAQLCRIERTRESAGKISREIAYAVTSLTSERAGPKDLLALWRDHWRIENTLHWRRDVILREDASRRAEVSGARDQPADLDRGRVAADSGSAREQVRASLQRCEKGRASQAREGLRDQRRSAV